MIKAILIGAAASLALAQPVWAQTDPGTSDPTVVDPAATDSGLTMTTDAAVNLPIDVAVDPVMVAVRQALPPFMAGDNFDLVGKLISVKPSGFLSQTFDPNLAAKAIFGRGAPSAAPDCQATRTAQGEADRGMCVFDLGLRDDPTGAYTHFAFSKNPGLGNMKMFKRPAFKPDALPALPAVQLTDGQAYESALKFMSQMGVDLADIPRPPAGGMLPVRTLALGNGDDTGASKAAVFRKVVVFQRGFEVPGGIGAVIDPNGNQIALNHVIAPGEAMVAIDGAGVQMALIRDWSDPQIDQNVNPRYAKNGAQLVAEIADELRSRGMSNPGIIAILIGLEKFFPNPDDPNPPLCPACGVLRPVAIVQATPAGLARGTPYREDVPAPGISFTVDLTNQVDAMRTAH